MVSMNFADEPWCRLLCRLALPILILAWLLVVTGPLAGSVAAAEVPGTILRAEAMPGAPSGAHAWRVLYRSTGFDGKPIAVSGVVIAPAGDAPPGGRPVVTWAHPTTGVVSRCTPSRARVFLGRDRNGRFYSAPRNDP